MTGAPLSIAALRDRVHADRLDGRQGGAGVNTRLAVALETIGWGASGGAESIDVAGEVEALLDDCLRGGGDVATLSYQVAELLRHAMPPLDGSMPSAAEFVPAAEEVLRAYLSAGRER